MTDQSIFPSQADGNQDEQQQQQAPAPQENQQPQSPAPQQSPFADKLQTITREDGTPKFQSVEAALESIPHANAHIAKLEEELANERRAKGELTDELNRAKGALEAVDRLVPPKQEQQPSTPAQQPAPEQGDVVDIDALVTEKVTQTLTLQEQKNIQKANQAAVISAMSEKFGEEAESKFYSKAAELGLTNDEMNDLARTKPRAVVALFPELSQPADKSVSIKTSSSHVSEQQPVTRNADGSLPPPENSILIGATSKDLMSEWRRHKPDVAAQ